MSNGVSEAVHCTGIEPLFYGFEKNPFATRKLLLKAWQVDPQSFRRCAMRLMRESADSPASRFILGFLLSNDNLADWIADPHEATLEQAVQVARMAKDVDPSFDTQLALRLVDGRHAGELDYLDRVLEILRQISTAANLLPLLRGLAGHPSPRIRSKWALVMGSATPNLSWVREQLQDPDGRVRANLIEALWGDLREETRQLFYEVTADPYPRTAINAALGLYIAGDVRAVERFFTLACRVDYRFRDSACWGMGRTNDPRFLPLLAQLVRDPEKKVRSNALRAIGRIRSYLMALDAKPMLRVQVLSAFRCGATCRLLRLSVRRDTGEPVKGLLPLSFVLQEDGAPIQHYAVEAAEAVPEAPLAIVLPSSTSWDEAYECRLRRLLEESIASRPAVSQWGVARYSNAHGEQQGCCAFATADVMAHLEQANQAPFSGFVPAIEVLMKKMPPGLREIVLVGSTLAQDADVALYQDVHIVPLAEALTAAGVVVNAIVPAACPPRTRRAMAVLTHRSGGVLQTVAGVDELSGAIDQLLRGLAAGYKIRYQSPEECSARQIKVLVHSPSGLGETQSQILNEAG